MHEYPILCCDVSSYFSKKNVLRDSNRSFTTIVAKHYQMITTPMFLNSYFVATIEINYMVLNDIL